MLLGNLAPIMVIGMARLLAEEGAEVIGQERHPAKIVSAAGETQPDIVVLDLTTEGARELGGRVQSVSPETQVILCDSGEGALEDSYGWAPCLSEVPWATRRVRRSWIACANG